MWSFIKRFFVVFIIGVLVGLSLATNPQEVRAQNSDSPVVYAVLFYLPTCGHCHEVINNHLPGIQARFGDQLKVALVNASTADGAQLMNNAIQALRVPSRGVPLMVVGSRYMIGSVNIPRDLPGIVEESLAGGGSGYPIFDGAEALLTDIFDAEGAGSSVVDMVNVWSDPANVLAVVVLAGLMGSAALITYALMQNSRQLLRKIHQGVGWGFALPGVAIGILLSISLALGSLNDPLTLLLSVGMLAVFAGVGWTLYTHRTVINLPVWVVPLVLVAGLLVAGYLAYVETTLTDATCGLMGNCNAVQQSDYAYLFGVPVGVLGVIGYTGLLAVWALGRMAWLKNAHMIFLLAVGVGVLFSAYLTFLEPFVIGATCAWCLTSTVIMTLLLWLSLPPAPEPPKARLHRRR